MTRLKTSSANVKKMHHLLDFFFKKIKNVGWHFCVRLTIGNLLRRVNFLQHEAFTSSEVPGFLHCVMMCVRARMEHHHMMCVRARMEHHHNIIISKKKTERKRQKEKEREREMERERKIEIRDKLSWIERQQLSDRKKVRQRENLRDGESRAREREKEKSKEGELSQERFLNNSLPCVLTEN